MTRVLVTRGLKKTTRLGGVRPAKLLDGTFAYFNDDNTAGIADCVRFCLVVVVREILTLGEGFNTQVVTRWSFNLVVREILTLGERGGFQHSH